MDRRRFLSTTAALAVSSTAMSADAQDVPAPKPARKEIDKGPPLDDELVKVFVRAAHGDLPKVEDMLAAHPRLINAVWDWGGGDFESALGGAAHTGKADIARLLLSRGARLDLFAAAMLGQLEVVKAALVAFPEALEAPGPHGIPLLAHARVGGAAAEPVLNYLKTLRKTPV